MNFVYIFFHFLKISFAHCDFKSSGTLLKIFFKAFSSTLLCVGASFCCISWTCCSISLPQFSMTKLQTLSNFWIVFPFPTNPAITGSPFQPGIFQLNRWLILWFRFIRMLSCDLYFNKKTVKTNTNLSRIYRFHKTLYYKIASLCKGVSKFLTSPDSSSYTARRYLKSNCIDKLKKFIIRFVIWSFYFNITARTFNINNCQISNIKMWSLWKKSNGRVFRNSCANFSRRNSTDFKFSLPTVPTL